MWPTIFYFSIFFIVPFNILYNYNRRLCGRCVCITLILLIVLLDSIANYIIPAVIFSVVLFVRVLYHKYRIRQRIEWRNYKKIEVQLLPISALYILLQLPSMILYAAYSAGLSRNVAGDYYSDSLYFCFWVILFTPFVSAVSLPELKTKCRNLILFWRRIQKVLIDTICLYSLN